MTAPATIADEAAALTATASQPTPGVTAPERPKPPASRGPGRPKKKKPPQPSAASVIGSDEPDPRAEAMAAAATINVSLAAVIGVIGGEQARFKSEELKTLNVALGEYLASKPEIKIRPEFVLIGVYLAVIGSKLQEPTVAQRFGFIIGKIKSLFGRRKEVRHEPVSA